MICSRLLSRLAMPHSRTWTPVRSLWLMCLITSTPILPRSKQYWNVRTIFLASRVFARFFKFRDLLGPAWTCSDAKGYIRMRLDAFECILTRSKRKTVRNFSFRNFCETFEEPHKNRRHQQVPHDAPDSFTWSRNYPSHSTWHKVPCWDGLYKWV